MSKWSIIAVLPRAVTMTIWSMPAATASSTAYWMIGLSTSGSISFGIVLVAGRNRVPSPAAGNTAVLTLSFTQSTFQSGESRVHGSTALPSHADGLAESVQ